MLSHIIWFYFIYLFSISVIYCVFHLIPTSLVLKISIIQYEFVFFIADLFNSSTYPYYTLLQYYCKRKHNIYFFQSPLNSKTQTKHKKWRKKKKNKLKNKNKKQKQQQANKTNNIRRIFIKNSYDWKDNLVCINGRGYENVSLCCIKVQNMP